MKPRGAASLTYQHKKTYIPYGLLEFDCVGHARSRSTCCCSACCNVLRQVRQVCSASSRDRHISSILRTRAGADFDVSTRGGCQADLDVGGVASTSSNIQTTRDQINVSTSFEECTCIAACW